VSVKLRKPIFAKLLRLPFIAAIPKSTSQEKIDKITFYKQFRIVPYQKQLEEFYETGIMKVL
jgi:hypothetical protein